MMPHCCRHCMGDADEPCGSLRILACDGSASRPARFYAGGEQRSRKNGSIIIYCFFHILINRVKCYLNPLSALSGRFPGGSLHYTAAWAVKRMRTLSRPGGMKGAMRKREKKTWGRPKAAAPCRRQPQGTRASLVLLILMLAIGAGDFIECVKAAPRPMKDQDRIIEEGMKGDGTGGAGRLAPLVPGMPGEDLHAVPQGPEGPSDIPPPEDLTAPGGEVGAEPGSLQEAIELERMIREDIPNIAAVELNVEKAKKALDALAAIYGKYDTGIENYPTLQEFADKTEEGHRMQAEIRRYGFKDVADWNLVIMNLGFAYSAVQAGTDEPIKAQIRAVENNAHFPPERKKELVRMLKVLIPTPNNRKVVKALMADPVYSEKLKLLDADEAEDEGEGGDTGTETEPVPSAQ